MKSSIFLFEKKNKMTIIEERPGIEAKVHPALIKGFDCLLVIMLRLYWSNESENRMNH